MPSFAVALSSLISAFYGTVAHLKHERTIWCIVLAGIGAVGFSASFTQQLGFGILGQKLTRRLRVLLFGHMLRQVRCSALGVSAARGLASSLPPSAHLAAVGPACLCTQSSLGLGRLLVLLKLACQLVDSSHRKQSLSLRLKLLGRGSRGAVRRRWPGLMKSRMPAACSPAPWQSTLATYAALWVRCMTLTQRSDSRWQLHAHAADHHGCLCSSEQAAGLLCSDQGADHRTGMLQGCCKKTDLSACFRQGFCQASCLLLSTRSACAGDTLGLLAQNITTFVAG